MSTALIIVGVALFLLVDAYVIWRWMLKPHRGADDLARVPVPGEAAVTLSMGKVKLTYQEGHMSDSTEHDIHFSVPDELKVEVLGGSAGGPLEIKPPGFFGGSVSTGPGFSRAVIGSVQITEPGTYTVTAGPALSTADEPTILVGK